MVIGAERRAGPDPARISFRALQTGDLALLYRWLPNPRVFRWYGGTAQSFAEITAKYAPRTIGQSPTKPYLIIHDDTPIGYIQTYPLASDAEYLALVGERAGADAAAIDIFIGEDTYAGRGLGAAAVRAFLHDDVFSDPALTRCFIDPHPDNSVAIRAYTRVGFRPLCRVAPPPPAEPCLLLCIKRRGFAA